MIPLPTSVLSRRRRSLVAAGGASAPAHPLQAYFDSGAIAIYLDSDGATLNGNGEVTAIANRGAGGAMFDTTVTGAPVPLDGKCFSLSASVGTPVIATPASMDGVRMMWVFSVAGLSSSMRLFGGANDEVRVAAIQPGPPRSVFTSLWSYRSGAGVSFSLGPRWQFKEEGLTLHELELDLTAGTAVLFQHGAQVASVSGITFTQFQIDRLGQGTGVGGQFVGLFGGILGILTGRPDTEAAIAATRAYLNTRFGLGLAL